MVQQTIYSAHPVSILATMFAVGRARDQPHRAVYTSIAAARDGAGRYFDATVGCRDKLVMPYRSRPDLGGWSAVLKHRAQKTAVVSAYLFTSLMAA